MTGRLPMTRGRVLALLIGVPLVLALIAASALDEVAFAGIGSYKVRVNLPVHGTVQLSVGSGELTVGQITGDWLHVTGKARYSLVRSTVRHDVALSGTSVSTQCDFPTGICDFNLHASVPAGTRTLISAGSGDILGNGLSGPQTVLRNGSGNITISGLTSANVSANDGSGDVTLTFTQVPDQVSISAGSGNVRLVLPAGATHYRVTASTGSGNRLVRVPTRPSSPYVITVTDGSGDITIVR
jgi:Putative adhesin